MRRTVSGAFCRACIRNSTPSMPGICMSVTMTAYRPWLAIKARAGSPPSAVSIENRGRKPIQARGWLCIDLMILLGKVGGQDQLAGIVEQPRHECFINELPLRLLRLSNLFGRGGGFLAVAPQFLD